MTSELTNQELAGLLSEGIEACGLDVDAELDRVDNLSPAERVTVIDDDQLAAMAVRMGRLPGRDDQR
jgi:hypothetical protein